MEQENLKKSNIFRRIYNIFQITPKSSWENLIIVIIGFILSTFLAAYFGITNFLPGLDGILSDNSSLMGGCFFVIIGIIELYIIKKVPLKIMKKNIFIFACICGFALSTGILCYWNMTYVLITSIIWILFYIYLQLANNSLSIMGLFGILIFTLTANAGPFWIPFPVETVISYGIFGFSIVLICSIPMFIIRILQKDPGKRELISRLFKKDIEFHDFINTKEKLVEFDNSPRSRSLISIAKELYIANNNLKTLSKYMEGDEDYQLFINEIGRLMNKVKIAILKGFDDGFEVNLSYITEYQKNLEFKLNSIENKNSDQMLLDITIRNYKTLFEDLNLILSNNKVLDTISPPIRHNNLLEVIKRLNLSDINLRYSIRSAIAIILSFISDYVFILSTLPMTTIISAFTIKPSSSNTNKDILIRFISTIIGIVIGIIISSILKYFELYSILALCDIIAFLLFFVFIENEELSLIFVMMGFIFLNYNESIIISVEHLAITIISMLIIIFISNFVLPSDEESNIIKLFNKKIRLIIKLNNLYLINNGEFNDSLIQEISNNNYDILRLFSKLNDTYSNIYKDIKIFTELNSVLEDYVSSLLHIQKYSKDYDLSQFGENMNKIFEDVLYQLEGEDYTFRDNLKSNMKTFIAEISQEKCGINFLLPSFININNNLMYISDLIIRAQKEEIFEIYNQDILEENIKDKINWKNINYLLSQYRYIFVAASYIYNISGEDIKKVAKQGSDSIQKAYNSSIKAAYNIAEEEIKEVYKTSSTNILEIKEYGKNNIKLFQETTEEIIDESSSVAKVQIVNIENGVDKLSKISNNPQDQVLDIYKASYENMDKIQQLGRRNINKMYTLAGDEIEIPEEDLNQIFSFSMKNIRFTYAFLKSTLFSSIKFFYKNGFRIQLDKDKALKEKQKKK